jgi:hypothetical protein
MTGRRRIDDREATVAKGRGSITREGDAAIVRTPVRQAVAHGGNELRADGLARTDDADDSTHAG